MRIKDANLNFEDKDIIGILGKGVYDEKRSNYLGKTTLLEAMRWALTGNSRASKNAKLVHFGEDMAEVEVELKDGNELYNVRRGVDAKGKGVLQVGWGDKSRESQQVINELLGIDQKDFDLTFFFKQAEISQFMNYGSADKKKLVMKWQKNDHWPEKEKSVKEDISKIKEKIKEEDITLRNLELNLGDEEELQSKYSSLRTKVSDYEKQVTKLNKQIEKEKKTSSITKKQYETAVGNYKRATREVGEYENKLVKVKEAKEELKTFKDSKSDKAKSDEVIDTLMEARSEINTKANNLESKINKIKKSGSGLCPVLDEPCDRLKISASDMKDMVNQLDCLKTDYADVTKSLGKARARKEKEQEDKLRKQKLESIVSSEKDINSRLESLRADLKENKTITTQYDKESETKLKELRETLLDVEDSYDDAKEDFTIVKHKIEEYEKNKDKIEELRTKLVKRNEILTDLQYVAFMYGKNGIPSLEIENSFQQIEDEINFVLGELDPSLSVEFKPDRVLSTWEELCLSCGCKFPKGTKKHQCANCGTARSKKKKDELQLTVIQNHNETDFEMCSGGLKTLVSLAVRAALTMLLKRQNHTKLNVLFLDEIDSALDEANKEAIMNLVKNVFVNKLGFSQIFWISHDKTISQSVPYTILVKGYKEHSELEWV